VAGLAGQTTHVRARSSGRKGQSLSSRDMHGMILDDVAGGHTDSPGGNSDGQ
jgi:hypothetical protein